MSTDSRRLGQLITDIQNHFLDTPGLRLKARDVAERFALDRRTCDALLDLLTEARVLTVDRGVYLRFFPDVSRHLAA